MTDQQHGRVARYAKRPHMVVAWVMLAFVIPTTLIAGVSLALWVSHGTGWWPREVLHVVVLPMVYCAIGIAAILTAKEYRKVRGIHD